MALTPFQVSKILDIIPDYFFKVRKLIIGGGPLYPELESRLERFDTRVYETYGMTETVSHVALRNVHPALEGFFHALEGVHFSTDSRNCLVVHAPDWGHESLITNDVVELNSATSFVWNGRYDFVINSGGLKIHPESLEKQLKNQLSTNFFVAGVPDDLLGEKAVLVVEAEKEISIDLSVVDRYRRPKKIYYLPNFVYTPSGKINRPETLSLI
jgi:O-succinylbenzoic acid--CoA ligase